MVRLRDAETTSVSEAITLLYYSLISREAQRTLSLRRLLEPTPLVPFDRIGRHRWLAPRLCACAIPRHYYYYFDRTVLQLFLDHPPLFYYYYYYSLD